METTVKKHRASKKLALKRKRVKHLEGKRTQSINPSKEYLKLILKRWNKQK